MTTRAGSPASRTLDLSSTNDALRKRLSEAPQSARSGLVHSARLFKQWRGRSLGFRKAAVTGGRDTCRTMAEESMTPDVVELVGKTAEATNRGDAPEEGLAATGLEG